MVRRAISVWIVVAAAAISGGPCGGSVAVLGGVSLGQQMFRLNQVDGGRVASLHAKVLGGGIVVVRAGAADLGGGQGFAEGGKAGTLTFAQVQGACVADGFA